MRLGGERQALHSVDQFLNGSNARTKLRSGELLSRDVFHVRGRYV